MCLVVFYISCIAYSSQPCISIPRKAARLTLSLQCIIKPRHAAPLPHGHRKHSRREQGGAGIPITYPSSSFCILLDLKSSRWQVLQQHYAAVSSFLHPGEQLPLACGLREYFLWRRAGFRARTCVYSQLCVFKAFYGSLKVLAFPFPSGALSELFPP